MTLAEMKKIELEIEKAETHVELDGIVTAFLTREGENRTDETYLEAAYRLQAAGQGSMAKLLRQANTKWFELEG